MEEHRETNDDPETIFGEEPQLNRREFFARLGKWSKIVIGVALAGGALTASDNREADAYGAAWVNHGGGGGWVNRYGGGGAWVNHGGGSAGWVNRGSGSGAWSNRGGGGWINRW